MLHISLSWSHPSSVYLFNFALWGAVKMTVCWPWFALWTQIKIKCCSCYQVVIISSLFEDPSIHLLSPTYPKSGHGGRRSINEPQTFRSPVTLASSDWGISRHSQARLEIKSLYLVLSLLYSLWEHFPRDASLPEKPTTSTGSFPNKGAAGPLQVSHRWLNFSLYL